MPASGVRFIAGDTTKFALTDNGIMYYGDELDGYFCGQTNNFIWQYMNLPTKLISSEINKLELSKNNQYLFIYMKNGDLYAIGNNTNGVLAPADTSCQRLLQKDVQNVQIGWSHSLGKQAAYYLINSSLYVYDSGNIQLFQNVSDFSLDGFESQPQNTFLLTNNSLTTIRESIDQYSNGTDLYCSITKNDPKCDQQQKGPVDCSTINDTFCYIQNCNKREEMAETECPEENCVDGNVTCWAIVCMKAAKFSVFYFLKECSFNYANNTYMDILMNASQYQFKNGIIISRINQEETNKSIFTTWPVVGMTVAGCVVVFTILGISIFMCVKCQMLKKQKPAEKTKKKTKKQSIVDVNAPGYTDEGAQHKRKQ
ncbi:Regulator_of chromosome condensation 1/beta-lactamase-inhibitor protein II [Hexamita inflata]|uniref:Regulator of chromosome condensation 1/beta-lactamase-inhibitor protein II n=1 Tax=Hexamita inflata TaxID=28002 RepID=A0AA86NY26_9EUKA|nr:Regulator of chromosome condensation 1/beta-lactamase-inhibitor protein II [Hexamita inflata]